MAKAYFLEGTDNEYILVIRTENKAKIEKIIQALSVYRDKEIDDVVEQLEESLHDRNSRISSKPRPKNKVTASTGAKHKSR